MLATTSRTAHTPKTRLLSGLMRCGVCGAPMVAKPKSTWSYYMCATKGHVGVTAEPVEQLVENLVHERRAARQASGLDLWVVPAPEHDEVLLDYAAALEMLSASRTLTRGERFSARVEIEGELYRRSGLRPGLRPPTDAYDPSAATNLERRRAAIQAELHYAGVMPTPGHRRFDPRRVELIWWGGSRRTIKPLPLARRRRTPSQRHRRRRWTDQQLMQVLRAWLAETPDHRISHYLADRRANPRLPFANVIARRFGSWSNAIVAMGYPPPRLRPHWTNDNVVVCVRDWLCSNPPREHDYDHAARNNPSLPCADTIRRHLGSWRQAVAAAGYESDALVHRWTTNETTQAVATWCAMTRPPYSPARYTSDATGNPNLPSMATVRARHGSWKAALQAVARMQTALSPT